MEESKRDIALFLLKMASSSLKGTRKTYSFEEREILITLINKYEDVEERKSDPISMCKRKSAWSQLAEEYNTLVGPQGARSAVQLRRCWENMKACKKNRDERKSRGNQKSFCQMPKDHCRIVRENGSARQSEMETSTSIGTMGLPPNVVFEPKESEPFTLQSVCTNVPPKLNAKKETEVGRTFKHLPMMSEVNEAKSGYSVPPPPHGPMGDCSGRSINDSRSPILDRSDDEDPFEKNPSTSRSNGTQTLASPLLAEDYARRTRKSVQREEELHILALSEAQMKVDIAAMLKEEARIKLEEAHYRKEEARLRMLLFTYKLDRIKED